MSSSDHTDQDERPLHHESKNSTPKAGPAAATEQSILRSESVTKAAGGQSCNPGAAGMARPPHWLWTAAAIFVALGFIAISVIYQKGAWLQYEADLFLVDHLGDRTFFSKVISPHIHDAEMYQAREFSHVLEHIDAHFIYWCVTHKIPHFYSIMNYVLLFIISLGFWWNATKHFRLDPLIALLLLGMFWSTPCIFMSGVYIRDAKQGTAFMVFFLVCLIIKRIAAVPRANSGTAPTGQINQGAQTVLWLQTFLLGLALCWMDRQGFFLVVAIALTLIFSWFGPPVPYRGVFLTALAAALLAHSIYAYVIAPPLIERLTGFKVSFEYQKFPLDKLFQNFFFYLWKGFAVFLDTFRYFFANVPRGVAIFIVIGIVWLCGNLGSRAVPLEGARFAWVRQRYSGLLVALWIALILLMNLLMVLRHEAVSWTEVRAFYYWIPATVLALIGVAVAVDVFIKRSMVPLWLTRTLLAAALLGNLTSLPEHHTVIRSGHLTGYMSAAPFLLTAIKDLYENPPGPAPVGTFDTIASSRNEDHRRLLKDPLDYREMTPEEFVSTSTFYNWLRSKRNLEFRQP
jgi:hypothetical protein